MTAITPFGMTFKLDGIAVKSGEGQLLKFSESNIKQKKLISAVVVLPEIDAQEWRTCPYIDGNFAYKSNWKPLKFCAADVTAPLQWAAHRFEKVCRAECRAL
jgi:hypothetical protein